LSFVFSLVGVDPMLAPLGYHGGLTPTHAPLTGSPAIDGGDDSLQAGIGDVPQFDQRGVFHSRVIGASIDVGAHETQPPEVPGDVNGDTVVDAVDYTIWRNNSGQNVGVYTSGDLTGDGFVDSADYAFWKRNFGNSLGGVGAISLARATSAAENGASSTAAVTISSIQGSISPSARSVIDVEPEAAEKVSFSTLAAPLDAGIARAWATLPEARGREADGREARERRSQTGGVAPHVRDLLLARIGIEERRADRQWQTDDAVALFGSAANEFAVDSAIDSLSLNTGPPGPFALKYRRRL
jgi:hypothetical protein